MSGGQTEFQRLVELHYAALYRFAFSLTRKESDAGDLVQHTFYIWATKGHQIREPARVKSWLFTTLHREHLQKSSRLSRFPEVELSGAEPELPDISPESILADADAGAVLKALGELDEVFKAPIVLFYLEDYTYPEIAEILGIPLGTVKSRLARGLAQLQRKLIHTTSEVRV